MNDLNTSAAPSYAERVEDGASNDQGIRPGPLTYVQRGWHIFPVHEIERGKCSCSKGAACPSPGKHPRTINGVKDATDSPSTIRAWLERWPNTNWAVACGPLSGLLVIDIDPRKNGFESIDQFETERRDGPLPKTLSVRTGGAGRHLFFRYPDDRTVPNRTNWMNGVDVKSEGGYVVLAGSNHISGATYEWDNWGTEVADCPGDVVDVLANGSPTDRNGYELPPTDDILRGVAEGERDYTLFRAACRWRRQLGDNAKDAVTVLALNAASKCDPPFPPDDAIKCVESAFKQDHSDSDTGVRIPYGPDGINNTDLGNSKRFARNVGGRLVWVLWRGWFQWDGFIWREVSDEEVMALAGETVRRMIEQASEYTDPMDMQKWLRHCKAAEGKGALSAMVSLAASDIGIQIEGTALNDDPFIVAAGDSVVDLRTGLARAVSPYDYITQRTHIEFDPSATAPMWSNFLWWLTKGDAEMIGFLKRLAGMTLLGNKGDGVFIVMTGRGGNGKTVFLDVLSGVLGDYALRAFPVDAITGRRSGPDEKQTALLFGKRLVVATESNQEVALNSAVIKAYTDETKQRGRWLYKNSFEFNTTHTLWFMSNHLPVVDDMSDGMWRRMLVLDFKNRVRDAHGADAALTMPEQIAAGVKNPGLSDLLAASEGSGILNWMIAGAQEYLRDGLSAPSSVKDRTSEYRVESDPMKEFIDEWVQFGHGEYVTRADLQSAYTIWCAENQIDHAKRLKPRSLVSDLIGRAESLGVPCDKNARVGVAGGARAVTGFGLKRPVSLGTEWS